MKNIPLSQDFWKNHPKNIAVVVVPAEPARQYHVGAQGIIEYAINESQASTINKQLKKTDLNWYHTMSEILSDKLNQKSIKPIVYTYPTGKNQPSYINIAKESNTDKVLIIRLNGFGTIRNYYSIIPLGAPEAFCSLTGELIDVSQHNKSLWRYHSDQKTPIPTPWDQPPHYPNVTTTVEATTLKARKELLNNLFHK